MRIVRIALAVLLAIPCMAQDAKPAATPAAAPAGVLSATEIQRLMPPSVFFQGQTATTQLRNSSGVRLAKGGLVLAGLVDTGGYSTAVRSKYQFYLLSDAAFEIGGKKLAPGAYGCGFVQEDLLIMDLGGNELFRSHVNHEPSMGRPRPLQVQVGKTPEEFRLYLGRDFVTIR